MPPRTNYRLPTWTHGFKLVFPKGSPIGTKYFQKREHAVLWRARFKKNPGVTGTIRRARNPIPHWLNIKKTL